MTTGQDAFGPRGFTGWESPHAKDCPQPDCGRSWPAGTVFRWIPWLRQYNWVCPACAKKFAAEYDERMAGAVTRAVAFIPAIPALPVPAVDPELIVRAKEAARDRMRRMEEQAGMAERKMVQGGLFG